MRVISVRSALVGAGSALPPLWVGFQHSGGTLILRREQEGMGSAAGATEDSVSRRRGDFYHS